MIILVTVMILTLIVQMIGYSKVYSPKYSLTSGSYTGSAQSWYIQYSPSELDSGLYDAGYYYGCTVAAYEPTLELVNLDFGSQAIENGSWGSIDFVSSTQTFISDTQIESAVESYMNGWYSCRDSHTLLVAVETNDSGNYLGSFSNYVSQGAGTNWADVVNAISNWSYSTYGMWTDGSNDFESGWCACESSVDTWINQYTSEANSINFLGYGGDAGGCYGGSYNLWYYPIAEDSTCNGYFSALGIFDIMYANGKGFFEPQQYNSTVTNYYINGNRSQPVSTEVQAMQYSNIVNYGFQIRNETTLFPVITTQGLACAQVGGCSGTDNPPATAWGAMYNALAAGNNTPGAYAITQGLWPWSSGTDMGYLNPNT